MRVKAFAEPRVMWVAPEDETGLPVVQHLWLRHTQLQKLATLKLFYFGIVLMKKEMPIMVHSCRKKRWENQDLGQ